MTKTQQEIVRLGYQALINSLGVVDSIRFIQDFNPGRGDYTKERHQWLDNTSLEELFQLMKQNPESENTQYDEIIRAC